MAGTWGTWPQVWFPTCRGWGEGVVNPKHLQTRLLKSHLCKGSLPRTLCRDSAERPLSLAGTHTNLWPTREVEKVGGTSHFPGEGPRQAQPGPGDGSILLPDPSSQTHSPDPLLLRGHCDRQLTMLPCLLLALQVWSPGHLSPPLTLPASSLTRRGDWLRGRLSLQPRGVHKARAKDLVSRAPHPEPGRASGWWPGGGALG